jgi:hypothetical protein
MDTHILRDIDRRQAEMEKDFALHRQALQYQIRTIESLIGAMAEDIKSLKKPRPALFPQIIEFLASPKVQKLLGGSLFTAGGYLLSHLTG